MRFFSHSHFTHFFKMECFKTNIRFTWNTNNNSAAKDKYQKRISRRRNPFKFFFSPFVCSTLGYVHLPNKQKQRSFSNNILYVQNYTYTFVISFIQRKRKKNSIFCVFTHAQSEIFGVLLQVPFLLYFFFIRHSYEFPFSEYVSKIV